MKMVVFGDFTEDLIEECKKAVELEKMKIAKEVAELVIADGDAWMDGRELTFKENGTIIGHDYIVEKLSKLEVATVDNIEDVSELLCEELKRLLKWG